MSSAVEKLFIAGRSCWITAFGRAFLGGVLVTLAAVAAAGWVSHQLKAPNSRGRPYVFTALPPGYTPQLFYKERLQRNYAVACYFAEKELQSNLQSLKKPSDANVDVHRFVEKPRIDAEQQTARECARLLDPYQSRLLRWLWSRLHLDELTLFEWFMLLVWPVMVYVSIINSYLKRLFGTEQDPPGSSKGSAAAFHQSKANASSQTSCAWRIGSNSKWTNSRWWGFSAASFSCLAVVYLTAHLLLRTVMGPIPVEITWENHKQFVGRPKFINTLQWNVEYAILPGDPRPTANFEGMGEFASAADYLDRIDKRWKELRQSDELLPHELWGYPTSPLDHNGWICVGSMTLVFGPLIVIATLRAIARVVWAKLLGKSESGEKRESVNSQVAVVKWSLVLALWAASVWFTGTRAGLLFHDPPPAAEENLPRHQAPPPSREEIAYHSAKSKFDLYRQLQRSKLQRSTWITQNQLEAQRLAGQAQWSRRQANALKSDAAELEAGSMTPQYFLRYRWQSLSPSEQHDVTQRLSNSRGFGDANRRAAVWANDAASARESQIENHHDRIRELTEEAAEHSSEMNRIDRKMQTLWEEIRRY